MKPTTPFRLLLLTAAFVVMLQPVAAQRAIPTPEPPQTLYLSTKGAIPYRIPAITQTRSGALVTVADYRYCFSDIGFGRVDLHARRSYDNGVTWDLENIVIAGTGWDNDERCGYGDPTVVTDAETDSIMLICVSGHRAYGAATTTRQTPQPIIRMASGDGGLTWTKPEELTERIYSLFDNSKPGPIAAMFVGSGKLAQSAQIKAGSHHRIYAPVCARPGGNRVVYSDDFGHTWQPLGGCDAQPAIKGDEPKCLELPNGDVLLSSRAWGGRIFNIFHYTDAVRDTGEWLGEAFSSPDVGGIRAEKNACNGGMSLVSAKRTSDGHRVDLLIHSVPLGPGRSNVGIFYKALASSADYASAETIARDWEGPYQVSKLSSAYSEVLQLQNGMIACFYEENNHEADYSLEFCRLTIAQLTAGRYVATRIKKKR